MTYLKGKSGYLSDGLFLIFGHNTQNKEDSAQDNEKQLF
jgi:hypothetical protein